jgi:hypothetical protein
MVLMYGFVNVSHRKCQFIPWHAHSICRGADKSLAFPIFIFAAQPKEFFLDRLKKLEQ